MLFTNYIVAAACFSTVFTNGHSGCRMPVLPTGRVPEVREGAGEPAGGRRGAAGRGLPAQEPHHPASRQGEYQFSIIINEWWYSQTKV